MKSVGLLTAKGSPSEKKSVTLSRNYSDIEVLLSLGQPKHDLRLWCMQQVWSVPVWNCNFINPFCATRFLTNLLYLNVHACC
jgi:hypothetical protein